MPHAPRRIRCPTCKKPGDWFAGPYGPFCSQRCKLVDLGRWLGEEYRFSEPLNPNATARPGGKPRETDSSPAPPDTDPCPG